MPTNPNVLVDREKYIGGSEISTILGINPFKTRYALLQEKALIKQNDFKGNDATEYGQYFEPIIRDYINSTRPSDNQFEEATVIVEDEPIGERYNYDGLAKDEALEIKTTSVIHDNVRDYKHYIVQLLQGMMKKCLSKGTLAVYKRETLDDGMFDLEFKPERLQIFQIDIEDYSEWCSEIQRGITRFKLDLVKLKADPTLTEHDLMPLQIKADSNAIEELENKLLDLSKLEKECDSIKDALYQLMQWYSVKSWTTNNGFTFTRVEPSIAITQKVDEFDLERFKEEQPELYNKYLHKVDKVTKRSKKGYTMVLLPKGK